MDKVVAYYRVSTKKQQCSGLALDTQRKAARTFPCQHAGQFLRDFTEVESRSKMDRTDLEQAAAFARQTGAVTLFS